MNIAIIDNDFVSRKNHNFPNLALMKISGFHKARGDKVKLIGLNEINPNSLFPVEYDKIYIGKAFTDTPTPGFVYNLKNVEIGGTGFFFDKAKKLTHNIEHQMPDYSLYENVLQSINKTKFYTDYSIGFTSRGCFRHCEFCVNKNSNKVILHSPIDEFHDLEKKKLALLDDNVLGLSNRELFKIFDKLIEINKPIQYRQGMDIRLLTEERIKRIFELRYDGDYYFAFDLWKHKDVIEKKMKLWYECYLKYKSDKRKFHIGTRVYLFTGLDEGNNYNESFWLNDLEILFKRIEICFKYKLSPYIMRYETVDNSILRKIYINLCQWTNHPSMPCLKSSFREFIEDGSFSTKETKGFFDKHKEFCKYLDLKISP